MPHVRPIHVTALALLAATFTIEAAQAHMPGVRTPSVSVPTNIPRTPGFTVPRDVNSGKSSNSQAGGKSQAGSKPSNASTPTASSPWSAPWDYAQSLHAADIAAKQKTVDDLYAQLQAAGAAMRNASDPANKTLRDRWEQLFSDWSSARQRLADLKAKSAQDIYRSMFGSSDSSVDFFTNGANWVTSTGMMGVR